jgi:hypothetical protein
MLENHKNYNCRVTTETGEEYLIYANWLTNNDLDNWKGWICEAGTTRLRIDKDLNIFSGECKNDYLGTTDSFELLNGTVCKQERCRGCTDDLMTPKYSPTINPQV